MKKILFTVCMIAGMGIFVLNANAVMLGFGNITGNNAANAALGEEVLFVDVTEDADQAVFTFKNTDNSDTLTSLFISQIYFDDGSGFFANFSGFGNTSGTVNYKQDEKPGNLPGGNPYGFETTDSFSPVKKGKGNSTRTSGIAAGETLGVYFNLNNGYTFENILTALLDDSPSLRIGIHVQGFGEDGGSESFITGNPTDPTEPTPEPATILLLLTGLSGLGVTRARKNSKK